MLRQETRLESGFSQGDPAGKIEIACKRVFDYCRRAFLAKHDWGFARREAAERPEGALRTVDVIEATAASAAKTVYTADVEDVTTWPPLARAAFVVMLARELCVPVCGRDGDLKILDALYKERVDNALLADLRDGCPAGAMGYETISLLGLESGISSAAQVDSVQMCLRRIDSIVEAAAREILSHHHWRFAWKSCEYSSVRPADCVRVQAVEDSGGRRLEWSIRGGEIAADAGEAVNIVYTAYVAPDGWPALAYAALVALVAAKTAARCALGADAVKALGELYAERLAAARAADLNEDATGSAIVREVMAVLKSEWSAADANLDESADALQARIAELLEPCRREVMGARRWNFARTSVKVAAAPGIDGEWTVLRPAECARVEAVKTPCGDLCDWSMRGEKIVSRDPVGSIVYIRDERDLDEWPPAVRRALVYRIAADASLTCAAKDPRHPDAEMLMSLYTQKLSDAALLDAREGNPGREAWGSRSFVDAFREDFRGRERRFRRG